MSIAHLNVVDVVSCPAIKKSTHDDIRLVSLQETLLPSEIIDHSYCPAVLIVLHSLLVSVRETSRFIVNIVVFEHTTDILNDVLIDLNINCLTIIDALYLMHFVFDPAENVPADPWKFAE